MSSYIVTCSSCGAANRIPAEKQGKVGHCGSCRIPLLPLYYQPQQLTDRSFDDFVGRYRGPVLAEFWAPW